MSPLRHPDKAVTYKDELQEENGMAGLAGESRLKDDVDQKADDDSDSDMKEQTAAEHGGVESIKAPTVVAAQEISESSTTMPFVPPEPVEEDQTSPDTGSINDEPTDTATLLGDPLASSTATLRPTKAGESTFQTSNTLSPPVYLDPTPETPAPSAPPSRSSSGAASLRYGHSLEPAERSPTRSDAGFDEKQSASEDEREGGSRSEIQSIMDQFDEGGGGPGHEEVMSPRLEFAGPVLGGPIQHPPRKSSLEPLNKSLSSNIQNLEELRLASPSSPNHHSRRDSDIGPEVPPKPGSIHAFSPVKNPPGDDRFQNMESPLSPSSASMHRPPPPEPEPEPDLPFDFHRFLEQLRHKTADPVAKFLRSFLLEFGKKQWMVHEQVKIISDFLAFITNKMAQCEVWREVSDAEFDNAREGMEKLVMNRLYTQTFSPAIPPPQPLPGAKPRRKNAERPMGPGRRGQHQEDVERDDILAQKVSIYGWVKEEHLDISPVGDSGKRFLILAQQGT
jgi:hypothetical protein